MMGGIGTDAEGFEQWYRREHPRLLAALTVASGQLDIAQDLVAEAFARALERWDRVSAMESPTGWVRQVAVNLLRRRHRRSAFEARVLRRRPVSEETVPAPAIDPDLWAAVLALPPRQRAVLGLRIVLDLSQDETARLLGIRPGTVSATLLDARRSVERSLRRDLTADREISEVRDG